MRAIRVRESSVAFEYWLPGGDHVRLAVYDVAGRLVTTAEDSHRESGLNRAVWSSGGVPSGIYFYRLWSTDQEVSGKLFLHR